MSTKKANLVIVFLLLVTGSVISSHLLEDEEENHSLFVFTRIVITEVLLALT